jgi:hypothetical protein
MDLGREDNGEVSDHQDIYNSTPYHEGFNEAFTGIPFAEYMTTYQDVRCSVWLKADIALAGGVNG